MLLYGRVDAGVTIHQKSGGDRYERRFYVTPILEVSRADYEKYRLDSINEMGYGWNNLTEYFNDTVDKAAQSRGEEISASGSDVRIRSNVEMGNNVGEDYIIKPRAELEKQREEDIKDARSGDRKIIPFNWDVTGKNKEKDLERETKGIPFSPKL
jgi:hypothetical protein